MRSPWGLAAFVCLAILWLSTVQSAGVYIGATGASAATVSTPVSASSSQKGDLGSLAPPVPPPNVLFSFADSLATCPAGDSVVAGHPARLRIFVTYDDGSHFPKEGVPPDSVWVVLTSATGNVHFNDLAGTTFADDTVRDGHTRITVPSISGCGTATFALHVSNVSEGTATVTVRGADADADADRRVTSGDESSPCDVNYDNRVDDIDQSLVGPHLDHWHRNSLHGSLVRRTNLCETCAAESTGTIGESEIFWSPDGKKIAFTIHTGAVVNGEAPCAAYIVPSDPSDGDVPIQFTFPDSSLHDYDPDWSPLGYEIAFDRDDRRVLRKGIPGIASDTTLHLVVASGDQNVSGDLTPGISPDGKWVAFSRRDNGPRHIYKVPITGGTPTRLTNEADGVDFYPLWSSDGVWITFDRQIGAQDQPHHVYKVKANGDSLQAIFDAPSGKDAATPAFSPDNAIVLFGMGTHGSTVRDVSTRTLDPRSSSRPAIPNYDEPTFSIVGPDPVLSPRLSADGTRLALRSKQIWAARRNMNLPPSITSVGGHTIVHATPYFDIVQGQDTTLTLVVSRSDPTGDALSDSAYFLRPDLGMSWTPSTRTYSWPVGDAPVGSYTVKFATSDVSGGSDYALARISVRDITAPAAVTGLGATCNPAGENEWDLSWTAVADDSTYAGTGRATQYDVRTSGAPITSANWNSATQIGGPNPPGLPGSSESMTVTVTGTTYLRMKVIDDVGNASGLSNQLILHTVICGGSGMLAGGGGGGGAGVASLQYGSGPQTAQNLNSNVVENSLLEGATPGTRASDLLRLPGLSPNGGSYAVRVREVDGQAAEIDDARLLVADHSSGVQAFALHGGVILGQEVSPVSAVDGNGADVASEVNGTAGPFAADSGAVLLVQLPTDSATTSNLVVVSTRGESDPAHGLVIEVSDGAGGWRARTQVHPRAEFDPIVVDSVSSNSIRLRFLSGHQVDFVGRIARASESPTVQWPTLVSAQASRSGDVTAAVATADTAFASLSGPDTLALTFGAPPLGKNLVRDCFLAVDATRGTEQPAIVAQIEPRQAGLPTHFALRPNLPNPFSNTTSVRFDLPVAGAVQIDVFDSQGRRVRRLADGFYLAGYRSVEWNGRDEGGRAARPGIYFCRMVAGNFRDRRRVVLLP